MIIKLWKPTFLTVLTTVSDSHDWIVMSDSLWPYGLEPARFLCPWKSPGKNTGVGWHFLFQRNFPTQGLNSRLLDCRQMLYHLNHQRYLINGYCNYSLKLMPQTDRSRTQNLPKYNVLKSISFLPKHTLKKYCGFSFSIYLFLWFYEIS